MKQERSPGSEDQALNKHPLLIRLAEMAAQLAGVSMVAIHADKKEWKQVRIGSAAQSPLFCRLIQGSPEGAKRCRMCHILMASVTGNNDVVEQHCHVGLSALVTPLARISEHSSGLISTCMFTSTSRGKQWKAVRACGTQLGLDLKQLRLAFNALPVVTRKKLKLAHSIMALAAEVLDEIKGRNAAEEKLSQQSTPPAASQQIHAALLQELKRDSTATEKIRLAAPGKGKNDTALIRAVASLITRQPALDYSATTIAAAARITPNHFSTLFRRGIGQSFLAFLTGQRIAASKTLLQDLSLNINEVANRTGYDDANYFARRFKQATGLTPRAWRNTLAGGGRQEAPVKKSPPPSAPHLPAVRAAGRGWDARRDVGDGG